MPRINPKNKLSEKERKLLMDNNLNVYLQTLIVSKAIKIEKVLEEKLELSKSAKEKVNFNSKFLCYQSRFLGSDQKDECLKEQIGLLQQIRNKLAHDDLGLAAIKNKTKLEIFWKILDKTKKNHIQFNKFYELSKYLASIDNLKESIKKTKPKSSEKKNKQED